MQLGAALQTMVASYAIGVVKTEILKRAATGMMYTAMWPLALLKLAKMCDSPFNTAKRRSEKAGLVLADALINRVQGERPVTLGNFFIFLRLG